MFEVFSKSLDMGLIMSPDYIVNYVLANVTAITFYQKFNRIFKTSLCFFSQESLLSFPSTTSKTHNPKTLSIFQTPGAQLEFF